MEEHIGIQGLFQVSCTGADGKEKWTIDVPNLICVGGGNLLLDAGFSNADPGPASYIGLITSAGFEEITRADTMSGHAWSESSCAGTIRPQIIWQSATSAQKRFSGPVTFGIIEHDTVTGIFIVYGDATRTVFDDSGVLWSAAEFNNRQQEVFPGDSISVQYLVTLFRMAGRPKAVISIETLDLQDTVDALANDTTRVETDELVDEEPTVNVNWAVRVEETQDTLVDLTFGIAITPDEEPLASFVLDAMTISRDDFVALYTSRNKVDDNTALIIDSSIIGVVLANPQVIDTMAFVELLPTPTATRRTFSSFGDDLKATFTDTSSARFRFDVQTTENAPAQEILLTSVTLRVKQDEVEDHFIVDTPSARYGFAVTLTESAPANDVLQVFLSTPGAFFEFVTESTSATESFPEVRLDYGLTITENAPANATHAIEPIYIVDAAGNYVVDAAGNRIIVPGTGP